MHQSTHVTAKGRPYRFAACILLLPALALGGCSATPADTAGAPQSAATTVAAVEAPKDAASLAKFVQEATNQMTTLSFTSEMMLGGQVISGSGQQKMSGDKLEAATISQKMGEMGQIDMIIVDGKVYAKLPVAMKLTTAEQSWVEISATSSNSVIAAMWTSMKPSLESSPVDTFSNFVQASSSVTLVGPETVDGVKASHYSVIIDPSKLSAGSTEKAQLESAGLSTIPTEMWIDEVGRPVKLVQKMEIQGQSLSSTMTFSNYGSPVNIKAPSANEISPS